MRSRTGLDLTGQRFGRLTAQRLGPRGRPTNREPNGVRQWECVCDCGNTKVVSQANLRRGSTRSCGCLYLESRSKIKTTHGHSRNGKKTRAYVIWKAMRQRCLNPKNHAYHLYGGAGVSICDGWQKFERFLADMGEPPPGASLDRHPDPHGDYEPTNCRWATPQQQSNNRRNNILITINGETRNLTEWCQITGIKKTTAHQRLRYGYDPVNAVTLPPGSPRPDSAQHAL